ncbi:MAG: nitroreductase [Desulfuromonadales bacterium]|nr:nitroreductase [Desulfuromonadales bacterium]NIR33159.1 nitroreductase [Desulfuromonadales bacterium]NIS41943.1 nitroreductase [Desulfuromonadales bacterium]
MIENNRTPEAEVDSMFLDRWSPRAMSEEPLSDKQIDTLLEAARWAPSCYNEQPWLYIYATKPADRERFATALVDKNRQWAGRAPMLAFILARRTFARTGKQNRHAVFDAGASWMALALQARKLGLYAHAMAGFKRDVAYEILEVPEEDYEIIAAMAVGYHGDRKLLPEDLARQEKPNGRKPPEEVGMEGRFAAEGQKV